MAQMHHLALEFQQLLSTVNSGASSAAVEVEGSAAGEVLYDAMIEALGTAENGSNMDWESLHPIILRTALV